MDGERGRRNGLAHPFPISPISFLCWHSPSLNYLSSIDGGNGANRSHSLSLVSCSRLRRWKRQTRREDGKGTGRWMLVTKRKEELLCHHSIPHCSTSGQAFPYPFLLLHSFPLPFVSSVITHALHGKERNDWEGMTVFPLPHSSLPESIVKTKGKGWMEVMCEEAIGRLVSSFHSSFSLLASFPFGPSLISLPFTSFIDGWVNDGGNRIWDSSFHRLTDNLEMERKGCHHLRSLPSSLSFTS